MRAPSRSRWIRCVGWLLAVVLAPATALCGGVATLDPDPLLPPAIQVADPVLEERMRSLSQRSPTWRSGLDSVAASGFALLVGTPADLRSAVPGLEDYRADHVGEVIPLKNGSGQIVGAAVAVDLARLRDLYQGSGLPLEVLNADVDRILIHEIYGHVVPLSAARTIEGGCPDPGPGEPAASSCAIVRENRIRQELRYELRTTYDMLGLTIGRYYYGRAVAP